MSHIKHLQGIEQYGHCPYTNVKVELRAYDIVQKQHELIESL